MMLALVRLTGVGNDAAVLMAFAFDVEVKEDMRLGEGAEYEGESKVLTKKWLRILWKHEGWGSEILEGI